MFEYLFSIFDLPLVCILILLALLGMLMVKNIHNIFLTLFTSIFLIIFIASTMLTQQVYLGEFFVISIFFILTIIFFVFNMNRDYDDSAVDDVDESSWKAGLSAVAFIGLFAIILLNFQKINSSKSNFILKNTFIQEDLKTLAGGDREQEYSNYLENISLLNQNKIFQKLTHIVMFYVCLVIVFYFFNRKSDVDEEKDMEREEARLYADDTNLGLDAGYAVANTVVESNIANPPVENYPPENVDVIEEMADDEEFDEDEEDEDLDIEDEDEEIDYGLDDEGGDADPANNNAPNGGKQ